MQLISHHVVGHGDPSIVFVHGFACGHTDWNDQVACLSPHHRTVTVDLRGHGETPGDVADCSIERYGSDIAEILHALALESAVVVGHSMGCRVVVEAALQCPSRVAGVVLVDGSRFSVEMGTILRQAFAQPDGYSTLTKHLFQAMFTGKSNPGIAAAIRERAECLRPDIGRKMLADMQRYDVHRLPASLGCLRVPVLAIQATQRNEHGERAVMHAGQTSPYLDMLRANIEDLHVEIIEDTGHFPQTDEPVRVNALLQDFLAA